MARLDSKVAAVTGGASGIGEATVRRFVAEGAADRHHEHYCEPTPLWLPGCYTTTIVESAQGLTSMVRMSAQL